MRRLRTARGASGIFEVTSAWARSTSTPVGAPAASRISLPPGGSAVFASIPASARAFALAQPAWPSTRVRYTGWPLETRSRSAAVGNCCPGQSFWSQPRPSSHCPAGGRGRERPPADVRRASPPPPGRGSQGPSGLDVDVGVREAGATARPARSSVSSPADEGLLASSPTATMRPRGRRRRWPQWAASGVMTKSRPEDEIRGFSAEAAGAASSAARSAGVDHCVTPGRAVPRHSGSGPRPGRGRRRHRRRATSGRHAEDRRLAPCARASTARPASLYRAHLAGDASMARRGRG
jgi:hypothetical protein